MKNKNMLILDLCAIAEERDVLFGEARGRKVCEALIALTPINAARLLVALDFARIEHASASFLREAVLGYSGYLRNLNKDIFPFAANLNEETSIELSLILRDTASCLVSGKLFNSAISEIEVLGLADGQHSKTLETVRNAGEVSVAELKMKLPREAAAVGTALNGRLEWLSRRGLLRSRQDGREKRYSFPFLGG